MWETSVGDKCKLMRPKAPRVGDKGETSVNSCGPRHAEWETRRKEPRVGDSWVFQGDPDVGDKWETSVN